MEVSIAEFRRRMKEVIEIAERDGSVTIISHGKPKFVVTRVRKKLTLEEVRNHPSCGMWKDREDMRDPSEWVANLRRNRGCASSETRSTTG